MQYTFPIVNDMHIRDNVSLYSRRTHIGVSMKAPRHYDPSQLTLWIFFHDELTALQDAEFSALYMEHWLIEMRNIVEQPIQIIYCRDLPGITDINYQPIKVETLLSSYDEQS